METVWVLGDLLNRRLGSLCLATPGTSRVLMVESQAKLASKPWHRHYCGSCPHLDASRL